MELIRTLDAALERTRELAFQLFSQRADGRDAMWDDWFQAERELFYVPSAELTETKDAFHLKVAVPGFRAEDLRVTVLPKLLIVEGEAKMTAAEGPAPEKEFGSRKMLRQFSLAERVKTDGVEASLTNGVLEVKALKEVTALEPVKVEVNTSETKDVAAAATA